MLRLRKRTQTIKVPLCKDVREFVTESRLVQTNYMSLEGSFPKRKITLNEIDHFKDFVEVTFYGEKSLNGTLGQKEADCVQKIVDVVKVTCQLYTPGEIHYTVIWLCFWEYSSKKLVCVPLMKIYKSDDSSISHSLFVDGYCNVYQNWNHCMDKIPLPHSFVCVPRFGKYNKIQDLVDLEYICFDGRFSKDFQSFETTPFSNFAIRPRWREIYSTILRVFQDNAVNFIKIAIYLILFYFETKKGNLKSALNYSQIVFMVILDIRSNLMTTPNTHNSTNSLSEKFQALISAIRSFYTWYREKNIENFEEIILNASNLYDAFKNFFENHENQSVLSNLNSLMVES